MARAIKLPFGCADFALIQHDTEHSQPLIPASFHGSN